MEFHYIRLANEIEGKVASGHIAIGERLPSLRRVQEQKGLSLSTVYQAYVELENRGVIEARNRSGCWRKKREMVRMICGRGIPLIEDDIYGDLYFGETRPTTLKEYDEQGLVLYCSSFSKTVLPDLRVGWVVPGRFKEKVKRLKFNALIATPKLNQMIMAGFMETGAYERHLRKMRNTLKVQVGNMTRAVANAFPGDTRMSSPEGGLSCGWNSIAALTVCSFSPGLQRLEFLFCQGLSVQAPVNISTVSV
ncbi:MAG: aminotransferase class I/II-fold pyridoxal phosphate-dependent enzyme [Proteobacteria bacterium]|nr:aminotransferase class I/II-fold pyridoxal phosphate-dependent enzyme [Pseudomonadota bacterium]MBU1648988.1 aminotransferase class I/II-fold pyridoxal phosphate-dependent enzyme [Pseudomonadota bacterium]MBU1986460.1 aminotransferase class I/II-fold pyridoxal phosphate-dependent enzyme [Pseudomonadota bacterium]